MSIVDISRVSPPIDSTAFPATPVTFFWTSTTAVSFAADAGDLELDEGELYKEGKPINDPVVRCGCIRHRPEESAR